MVAKCDSLDGWKRVSKCDYQSNGQWLPSVIIWLLVSKWHYVNRLTMVAKCDCLDGWKRVSKCHYQSNGQWLPSVIVRSAGQWIPCDNVLLLSLIV